MSSKFDEHEKERLEKEVRIVEFACKVVSLSTKVEKLECTADKMKKYSRRNSILTHGLPKEPGEDTDSIVIETVISRLLILIGPIELVHLLNNQVS